MLEEVMNEIYGTHFQKEETEEEKKVRQAQETEDIITRLQSMGQEKE